MTSTFQHLRLARRYILKGLTALLLSSATLIGAVTASEHHGRFVGHLDKRQIGNGSDWKLLSDLTYIDPAGRKWKVPSGTIVNGASIPRVLWPIGGYPWDGPLGKPSVIHDYFWNTKSRSSRDVHRAFRDGLRANGVSRARAAIAYAAVRLFGGRWTKSRRNFIACAQSIARQRRVNINEISAMCDDPVKGNAQIIWNPKPREADWRSLKRAAEQGQSLEQIDKLSNQLLLRSDPHAAIAKELGLVQE